MATGDDPFVRLLDFAVRAIKLARALPRDMTAQHIARQILRSGTSAGANYEEARGAESHADFVHKIGIVLKELKETRYWLMVISQAKLLRVSHLRPLLDESGELCAIIGQSVITAKKRRASAKSSAQA